MKRGIGGIVSVLTVCFLASGLFQTALAADTYRTTHARVNFRAGPSTDTKVIKQLVDLTTVEMLEYDPDGWSKVSVGGVTGYIKSEYLSPEEPRPSAETDDSTIYITVGKVNFRAGPSTDTDIIDTLSDGAPVTVLEYDPDGWSKAEVDGVTGYIKSEYLSPKETRFRTTDRVNFRAGPSTDDDVIKKLNAGTLVTALEYDPDGWSLVEAGGETGYIRSDLLRSANYGVELLEWPSVKAILPLHTPLEIYDVRTGVTYTVQSFSNGQHADVEPKTKADTDAIFKTYGGKWSYDARPVWVTFSGRTIAAAINGWPHGGGVISGNGMNGQICLHFYKSKSHNGNTSYDKKMQAGVTAAWNAR